MFKSIPNKLKNSFFVIAPISAVIFLLCLFVVPTTPNDKINLGICFGLLVVGLAFFENGAEVSMSTIGETVGSGLCRTRKLWIVVISSLVIGFIITFAEPDLQVFAEQAEAIFPAISSKWIVVITISAGVAISLLLAVFRIIFKFNYAVIMLISYLIVIVLSFFLPSNLLGFTFDSGSVTTGPISVPFVIAFGLGISTVLWRNKKEEDAFGTIGICSVGPIIACMLLCLFFKDAGGSVIQNSIQVSYGDFFIKFFKEVAIVILPILIIFLIFQGTMIKYPKKFVRKILFGLVFTYVGVVLFLVGVNVGYLPLGYKIGNYLGGMNKLILILVGLLFGFCSVIAEPALAVLKNQINQITKGKIKPWAIVLFMAIGVSLAVFTSCLCVVFNIPVSYFIIPLFVLIIILSFVNTKLFTVISFDSGGVATGAMAVSFILPFMSGASIALGASGGFGTVALIAAFPILSLEILGIIFKIKTKNQTDVKRSRKKTHQEIIDFDWEVEWVKEKHWWSF